MHGWDVASNAGGSRVARRERSAMIGIGSAVAGAGAGESNGQPEDSGACPKGGDHSYSFANGATYCTKCEETF